MATGVWTVSMPAREGRSLSTVTVTSSSPPLSDPQEGVRAGTSSQNVGVGDIHITVLSPVVIGCTRSCLSHRHRSNNSRDTKVLLFEAERGSANPSVSRRRCAPRFVVGDLGCESSLVALKSSLRSSESLGTGEHGKIPMPFRGAPSNTSPLVRSRMLGRRHALRAVRHPRRVSCPAD